MKIKITLTEMIYPARKLSYRTVCIIALYSQMSRCDVVSCGMTAVSQIVARPVCTTHRPLDYHRVDLCCGRTGGAVIVSGFRTETALVDHEEIHGREHHSRCLSHPNFVFERPIFIYQLHMSFWDSLSALTKISLLKS